MELGKPLTSNAVAERAEIDRAVAGKTLCDAFAATAETLRDQPALKWREASGWQSVTWGEYREQVLDLASGLRALGLEPGSFALLMGRNRSEYTTADLAVVHAGGVPVSAYNSLSRPQLSYVANHCQAAVAIVENWQGAEKLASLRDELPYLRTVVLMEAPPDSGDPSPSGPAVAWEQVLQDGHRLRAAGEVDDGVDATWRALAPDNLATVLYTSGTTGPPKGVMLTHANVMWTMESVRRAAAPVAGERVISYLPLAHALERWWSHWNGVVHGVITHFCPNPRELLDTLLDVRPSWFFGVPQVWERLANGISAGIDADPDDARRAAVKAAIEAGRALVHEEQAGVVGDDVQARYEAVRPILAAVLAKVGLDQCRLAVSGSAPVPRDALELFRALGLPLTDGWGMTELTGNGAWGGVGRFKPGTVGRPLPGIEIRTEDDGELLVRGGNVMAGYYKDPEQTAQVLSADGWLRTGDLATIDEDGYLILIGRKKDVIITAGGKNIAPANIENLLECHPLIGHACVVGDRRPYLVALVVLDPETVPQWAAAHSLPAAGPEELADRAEVRSELERWVEVVNGQLSQPEQVRRFEVLPAAWTVERGELTPTLKVRRAVVTASYEPVIEALYT